ncbi:MAG: ATP-grasp domain-containing protein [Treponema sp.]|nr:ATP-grasp domain-containing protein [Treponema sp.]
MRIVFYSTNSNLFDEETFKISVMPSNTSSFKDFCKAHPEDEFFCVTQKPGMFLPEQAASNVHYLPQETDIDSFTDFITSLKPELAIAMTFWISPYDWLPVSDALVAQKLEEKGIKTVCNSLECGINCFDKWRTHNMLSQLGFNVPKAVFVDHDLYFCAGSNREVIRNVYKESVFAQLKELKLPLIIKDTTGLSSYGMTVVHTYGEAAGYLNSKRNNSNRLIEEFISGRQFGLEIYGVPGAYQVMPPFEFSVNQYGITSPKLSIKYGPSELPDTLHKMMLKLAEGVGLCGIAQVDLILDDKGNWNIIEINPRLSGMTYTYACLSGLSVYEIMYRAANAQNKVNEYSQSERIDISSDSYKYILNLKLPLMSEVQMKEIFNILGVKLLNQTNDLAARQEREKGFCECIICSQDKSVLQKAVEHFEQLFPGDAIILQAMKILEQ